VVVNIIKCDICKKKLQGDPVKAGVGFWSNKDFCQKCGKPILDFLKKYKFIKEKTK